jgi:cell division septum initiation protein DivIVA
MHTATDNEHLRQEIAAIRERIAENEQALSRIKPSTVALNEPTGLAAERDENASIQPADEEDGVYLYGIAGRDPSPWSQELPGIDPGNPVFEIPYRDIRAVVSRVPRQEYSQVGLKVNLNNMQWVVSRAQSHEDILMASRGTVIPMRFCTICRAVSSVQEILTRYYDRFIATLTRLDGKQEWGIKVYCDRERLARNVEEASDRARELRTKMSQQSSGMAYFLSKKLEEVVAGEVERTCAVLIQCTHDRLSGRAGQSVVNPLQNKETTGRSEAIVFNVAYLVAQERCDAFRTETARLAEEHREMGFSYELAGPWPPYHFVDSDLGEGIDHE